MKQKYIDNIVAAAFILTIILVLNVANRPKESYCITIQRLVLDHIIDYERDSMNQFHLDTFDLNLNRDSFSKTHLINLIVDQTKQDQPNVGIVLPVTNYFYKDLIALYDAVIHCNVYRVFLGENHYYIFPKELPLECFEFEQLIINEELI